MASNKKDNSNETNDELELFEFKKDLLNLKNKAQIHGESQLKLI